MNEFEKQMMNRANGIIETQPDLKEQSENRARYKFQEEFPFEEPEMLSNDAFKRRPCTKEEKEQLDLKIEKLADILKEANFYWQLDGALNISLYEGGYIGVHKDLDISLDIKDIDEAEEFLTRKGLGLFLKVNTFSDHKKIYERVGVNRIKNNKHNLQLMIFAVDSKGEIKKDNESFGIDTHIIKRNYEGEAIGYHDTILPEHWIHPMVVNFHGKRVNCSHPASVAYYKLYSTRNYDDEDLKSLAKTGLLTNDDIDLIEKTFNEHIANVSELMRDYVGRIFAKLKEAEEEDQLVAILADDEMVRDKNDPIFKKIAQKIFECSTINERGLLEIIIAASPIGEIIAKKDKKMAILRNNILI